MNTDHFNESGIEELNRNGKLWTLGKVHNVGKQYQCVQMETKSQMLERKVICIDLFVPFNRGKLVVKWKVIPRLKTSVHSENIVLMFSCSTQVPDVQISELLQLQGEASLF